MPENEDVAKVLARLKEEIRTRKVQSAEIPLPEAQVKLRQVYATARVNPHLPIGWPKLPPGIIPKIVAIAQKVVRRLLRWYINPIVEQQNAYNAAVTAVLEDQTMEVERLKAAFKEIEQLEAALKQEIEQIKAALEQVEQGTQTTQVRLQRLERAYRASATVATVPNTARPDFLLASDGPWLDYFRLELQLRPPQLLRKRQADYLKYFEGRQNVLDIGCGRGEFVEMLLQKGISARGIDLDRDAVAYAKERGLPVDLAEAMAYLQDLPDESLGGVFASQVIEHLKPRQLQRLLELCHDKLVAEAPIVLETLNPACLVALANWFVIDPTHVWPVHSETLKFMLENAGFWKISIEFVSPVPPEQRLRTIPHYAQLNDLDAETVSLLNHNIELLNHTIFGYQDYVAIAWRPPHHVEGTS